MILEPITACRTLLRDRLGRVTIEQGLIAALVGVVTVSVVTTLTGVLDVPARADPAAETAAARDGG
jgi:Flp pilus assembly pilin Flp